MPAQQAIQTFKQELTSELEDLLNWWASHALDESNGGFYGKIDNHNIVDPEAPKGLVLNTRILYTFSAAYLLEKRKQDLALAERAFTYLLNHFLDPTYGGFYWSVDFKGKPLDDKKQIYGQAFAIYALATYYKACKEAKALEIAKATFSLLEQHSFDPKNSGYIEALSCNWQPIADLRLSAKDLNEKKSMNTHLHVIEAYACLYTVWENGLLKTAVKQLLANFKQHIIDPKTHHLQLFFTDTWELRSTLVSFGHDIEAAWLLQEAAELIEDEDEITAFKQIALKMAEATRKGLDKNGGLYYEYDPATNHWIKAFHWWPQAEAMVGFFNAYELNKDEAYLHHALNCWNFIKSHLKDQENGEWFWGVEYQTPNTKRLTILADEDKAGFWKCPYHNGRACIELIKRCSLLS